MVPFRILYKNDPGNLTDLHITGIKPKTVAEYFARKFSEYGIRHVSGISEKLSTRYNEAFFIPAIFLDRNYSGVKVITTDS